jgi:hypothetical protein
LLSEKQNTSEVKEALSDAQTEIVIDKPLNDTAQDVKAESQTPVQKSDVSSTSTTQPPTNDAEVAGDITEADSDYDVDEEDVPAMNNTGSNGPPAKKKCFRIIRARDPSLEDAPVIVHNPNGKYHSITAIGACKKANDRLIKRNEYPVGKLLWLIAMSKEEIVDDETGQSTERKVYHPLFFTKIPSPKPKRVYFYDPEVAEHRKEILKETKVVESGDKPSTLLRYFRQSEGDPIMKYTPDQIKETKQVTTFTSKEPETKSIIYGMEEVGLYYERPSASLTIEIIVRLYPECFIGLYIHQMFSSYRMEYTLLPEMDNKTISILCETRRTQKSIKVSNSTTNRYLSHLM